MEGKGLRLEEKESILRRIDMVKLIVIAASIIVLLALLAIGLGVLVAKGTGNTGPIND